MLALAPVVYAADLSNANWPKNNGSNGEAIFEQYCVGCHVNGGNIIRRGKNLKLKALRRYGRDTPEAIADLVKNGKNNMSAYGDRLSDEDIADVTAYVLDRAAENWR
ncbi:MAG: c-type cytochrome [Cyanobacteria bacterium SID2]|nr:c-type cytochrome [Cyanobacteria bacterium SID2]MBP0005368.1 c-type cytochrome [Cyanobacteria bacterium SBC]